MFQEHSTVQYLYLNFLILEKKNLCPGDDKKQLALFKWLSVMFQ